MESSSPSEADLWYTLIDKLDEGVIVFDERGVVIYANAEAAHLLAYSPQDMLELDKEDFVALCDANRLDGPHFVASFLAGQVGGSGSRSFQIVMSGKRLDLKSFSLESKEGSLTVLLLREDAHWRSDLIALAVMTDMHSPMAFAADYATMLSERVKSGNAHPYEIGDLARIIHESLGRALELWRTLSHLYSTVPGQTPSGEVTQVNLKSALAAAVRTLSQRTPEGLASLRLELPGDLPPVRVSAAHLHTALCILLEQALLYLPHGGILAVTGRDRERHVQVDLAMSAVGGTLRSYHFDELPLAIAEGIILRYGGRVWIQAEAGKPLVLSFVLPVGEGAPG